VSRKNVEIVQRVTEAFAKGDLDTVFDFVSPTVEWDFSHADTWLEEQVFRGYGAIGKFFDSWFGEWDDYRFDVEEVIDAGDKTVVVVHDEGRSKTSGVKLERRHAEVWTVSEEKVVRVEAYDEKAQALEAVGLSA
jgi:uncharacterized protein